MTAKNQVHFKTNLRPFSSKYNSNTQIRKSLDHSERESKEVENELFEIESRLVKGNVNHYKNLMQKSKLVHASNEAAHMTSLKAREKVKNDEETKLNNYVLFSLNKSKKMKDTKKELKFFNEHKL